MVRHIPAAPQQERSRQTLERTLAATERLLRSKPFEEITIVEIVRLSKSSVGSFYARFGSKEGLLPHLYERYDRALHRRVERRLAEVHAADLPLEELARWMIRNIVSRFRRHRWLIRAVGLYARSQPQVIPREMQARRDDLHRRVAAVFGVHRHRIPRDDPQRAVALAIYFVNAICRDKILFPAPHARATRINDDDLVEELTRVFLSYLGVRSARSSGVRASDEGKRA